jgi:hypothetical protein
MIAISSAPSLIAHGAARSSAALAPDERAFLGVFIALVVIVAFPGKFLFYSTPGVAILLSLFVGRFINCLRLIAVFAAVVALSALTTSLDAMSGAHINCIGLVLGTITYLPIFILWSPSKSFRVSDALMWRIAIICSVFICVQAGLGALQLAATRNGDFVSGTFGLFDFAADQVTISQVNYCFTLFCMVVFCAIWLPEPLILLTCVAGLVAALVAEAAHQTIFFLALLPVLAISGGQRVKRFAVSVLSGGGLLIVAFIADPGLYDHAQSWADKVLFAGNSPKRLAVVNAVTMLSDPKNLVLGVGLGQFSSRAAILSSGAGTSVNLPPYLVDTSTYFDQYLHKPIQIYGVEGEASSMAMPYFSALSVITEFGVLFAAGLLIMTIVVVVDNIRYGKISPSAQRIAYYCNFLIGFIFLCSFIQNYLELTQAIMIPILLYIIAKARLRTLTEEAADRAQPEPFSVADNRGPR